MMPQALIVRSRSTSLLAALALVAGNVSSGCSKGGAPDGWAVERGDMFGRDGGLPDGRPPLPTFDLARPAPRTQVDFAAAAAYPVDSNAYQITIARINNDAYPDIVVVGAAQINAYVNNGDGTFTPRASTASFGGSWQIAAEDLNGDGLADLAVTNYRDHSVDVLIGKGDGTFGAAVTYLKGTYTQGLVAVALNGDAALDLAVGDYMKGQASVLLNNGDGTFRAGGVYQLGTSSSANPYWLVRTDLNRDGKMDILSANNGDGEVTFLAGEGDGTLKPFQVLRKAPVNQIDVGDLNLDGNPDVALIGGGLQTIQLLRGNGNGTINSGELLMLSTTTGWGVRIGDLNGDTLPDVVGVCNNTANASVFIGKGDGTFLPEKLFPIVGKTPWSAAIADFNLDGLNDLVLSEGSELKISVLINKTMP